MFFATKASLLMITMPLGRRSSMLARSAAGLSATSTSGWSAGVRMSVDGEVDLEAGDAGQRAGRGADLGGKVREGREVVARERGRLRELGAGELHAVARIARESDRDAIDLLDRLLVFGHVGCLLLEV